MTPDVAENSRLAFALCLTFILMVPFAIAGIALLNTGLGRSRSAAHAMTSSLCVISVAVLIYFAWGDAIQAYPTTPGTFLRGVGFTFGPAGIAALLAFFSVALASLIPLGAASDRWRISAACASTVLFAGCIYPVYARLAWRHFLSGDVKLGLGHFFIDIGGSGVIQATGGLTALSVVWLLGPRRGKYLPNGMPAAIPAHNGVYVLFGCMLAWIGWMGLNSASAIVYDPRAQIENSVLVAINTTFSAMAAALTAAAVTRIRFRKPDASLIANGWVGGLVASSAGCASLKPATAVLTGFVAGALVVIAIEFLEFTLKIDDPCGSVSVHAVAGVWGLLAVGIFSGSGGQLLAQLVGVATLLGLILPLTYGLNWLLNRFIPYRVSSDGEGQGLDLHELGADAYPEFAVHADEFMQR
jgi:Amt family ammonium transporter